jgi:formylglycine-generating enzyme required for sulfatase activity
VKSNFFEGEGTAMCEKLLRFGRLLGAALLCMVMVSAASAGFTYVEFMDMDFAVVGNPGNAGNTRHTTTLGWGAVGDYYLIGKTEITAGQYTEFLNAVAKTDTHGLYNTNMWSSNHGCKIQQTGTAGSWEYSVASDRANRPVNYVSFWDAVRYANWLHNGKPTGPQGSGTTESGAYVNLEQGSFARTDNAKVFLPTADEWYKAAYHNNQGMTGLDYYDYPTGTDTPPGNAYPDTGNNANFGDPITGWTIGSPYYRTEVGDFIYSPSPYGTFDQGGNVYEWNETADLGERGALGGDYAHGPGLLHAQETTFKLPTAEDMDLGFRIAADYWHVVPEPGSATLLLFAAVAGLLWRRR